MEFGSDESALDTGEYDESRIRYIVESALRQLATDRFGEKPKTRHQWIERLVESLVSEAEAPYKNVIDELTATGITSQELVQSVVPEASRLLGEYWVCDKLSFVDVTLAAGRLQRLVREEDHASGSTNWLARTTPLGQSILMVIPQFEDHSLGAFVAADGFRRHGIWVHMAIGLDANELISTIRSHHLAMIGMSLSMREHIYKTVALIDTLRASELRLPPIVVGGRLVGMVPQLEVQLGADFTATSPREAIEKCGLSSVASALADDKVII
ncbi:MAG: cobalamin-dependent protein [Pseudomonadota bacterium]